MTPDRAPVGVRTGTIGTIRGLKEPVAIEGSP